MKKQILLLLFVIVTLVVNAQWRRNVTPADTLTSIVTNADGSTTFRIYAPKAEKVTLGGGDNDASWTSVGCAGNILDNLYAEGKIAPMIVVMPHGGMDTEKFVDELVVDIMPRVAEQYRIKTGSKNTALAGLPMGGLETLNCFMAHPDLFGYINVMSSGWFRSNDADRQAKTQKLREIASTLNKTANILRFTMGGKSDIAYENCQQMLNCFDEAGIKYEYSDTPGGHSWHVWHYDLLDFAPRLFK